MSTNLRLTKNDSSFGVNLSLYKSMIGSVLYINLEVDLIFILMLVFVLGTK